VAPFYPQKLAITSPTSGGRSVGIVRSQTQTMEFCLFGFLWNWNDFPLCCVWSPLRCTDVPFRKCLTGRTFINIVTSVYGRWEKHTKALVIQPVPVYRVCWNVSSFQSAPLWLMYLHPNNTVSCVTILGKTGPSCLISLSVSVRPAVDLLCGLVVRVPGYTTEMYCVSCEVRTEFIYVM
jgi:hypothetical protein